MYIWRTHFQSHPLVASSQSPISIVISDMLRISRWCHAINVSWRSGCWPTRTSLGEIIRWIICSSSPSQWQSLATFFYSYHPHEATSISWYHLTDLFSILPLLLQAEICRIGIPKICWHFKCSVIVSLVMYKSLDAYIYIHSDTVISLIVF